MVTTRTQTRWWVCGIAIVAYSLSNVGEKAADAANGAPIPPSPEFTAPAIKPTLPDFLRAKPIALKKKLARTDPLQRPPFAGAPADSLKGMASGIRAVQLDAPNRVKAAQYLGTVDCVTYPQAQEMLIDTMQNDPSEEVRYEAAMALRTMLSAGCGNMDSTCECESCADRKKIARETERHSKKAEHQLIRDVKGPAKKLARQVKRDADKQEERYDCCRGCCNAKVLTALSKVAFEKDEQCCWVEPSERVREAAEQGLCLCATSPALFGEPILTPIETEPKEPMVEEKEKEVAPPEEKETTPGTKNDEKQPSANSIRPSGTPRQVSATKPSVGQLPVIAALNGYCVVALKERQFVPTNPSFSSTFEDRTYFFSSADAKTTFDRNPESYAPAYGGLDPVVWLEQRQMVEGKCLREFDGRFYLFVNNENWETFKSSPNRFVLNGSTKTSGLAAR